MATAVRCEILVPVSTEVADGMNEPAPAIGCSADPPTRFVRVTMPSLFDGGGDPISGRPRGPANLDRETTLYTVRGICARNTPRLESIDFEIC